LEFDSYSRNSDGELTKEYDSVKFKSRPSKDSNQIKLEYEYWVPGIKFWKQKDKSTYQITAKSNYSVEWTLIKSNRKK